MRGIFSVLTWRDILFAACLAYVITYMIRSVVRRLAARRKEIFLVRPIDTAEAYERCKELFPIEHVIFRGRQFQRGMQVKITTMQKNTIEGELVGVNRLNLICIRTQNQIIAHQMEKIEEIAVIE